MRAFLFPGQGSQSIGMGREIYEAFPCAKDVFQEVDEALKQNLTRIIFEGPESDLGLTENTQPALMTVSMALMRVLEKEGGLNLSQEAAFVAGHSLGQYSALCAAGALSLADTARLLKIRGQAMQKAVPLGEGAMAAILGLEMADVEQVVHEAAQKQVCEVANDNSPGQVFISGHKEAVERAVELSKKRGAKRSILLNVSAPFHCVLMKPAQERMATAFQEVVMKNPCVPVFDNFSTEAVQEGANLTQLLIDQITGRVRWRESIEKMAEAGVTTTLEIGAGKVLTGLSKRICSTLESIALNTPYDIESLLKQDIAA
ncbi:MAG: ACP S-malonyltransferase [Alphaproteobacteria bacterium]|nr:ACP S-malonyltransferase [Alphaproteobacteria bacterium]